jgi:hypothetical protein
LDGADDLESRIVWLLGSPRSGSTWLAQLLTRVTGGAHIREPLIGAHLGLSVGGLLGLPVDGDPLLLDTMTDRPSYFFAPDAAEAWREPLRDLLLARFAFDARRHELITSRPANPIIVKEPWGSAGAPILLRALPRSRLLFLVRDGRDVVDSLLDGEADGWITKALGARLDEDTTRQRAMREHALMWTRGVEAVQKAFDTHPPALRLRVTYEDLLTDTDVELRRALDWLGREDLNGRVADAVEATRFAEYPAGTKGAGKFRRTATPGLWRDRFSADEQAALEAIMRPSLARFGYV